MHARKPKKTNTGTSERIRPGKYSSREGNRNTKWRAGARIPQAESAAGDWENRGQSKSEGKEGGISQVVDPPGERETKRKMQMEESQKMVEACWGQENKEETNMVIGVGRDPTGSRPQWPGNKERKHSVFIPFLHCQVASLLMEHATS